LALAPVETKLVTEYETVRRREYELLTKLLEVMPRVDNLGEAKLGQMRDALFHADHPFLIVLVGPFNSGKSSIINALLGESELLPIGPVPTTDKIAILRYGETVERLSAVGSEADTVFFPSALLQKVSFVDTPGLESVFQKHEDITRKFMHRADVVLMVMLATQAMTARNLEYIQTLKEYGKKVILVINQADLLSAEEAEVVREYVTEQSQSRLGFRPDVWLVSARQGMAARQGDELDKIAWKASGLSRIEEYVDDQLNDVARLRQKLQTPLTIAKNVNQSALMAVRTNQAALDQYQGIAVNIDQQLAAQKRDQAKTVRDMNTQITEQFTTAADRGSAAIQEIFQFSNALRSIGGGLLEVIPGARLLRGDRSYVQGALERHKASEPILNLPEIVAKLGPRLEGKDIQDIEDLVKYARREIDALPAEMQQKVIGSVQAPVKYDRQALQAMTADLEAIETEARQLETDRLEQALRGSMMVLAVVEILLVIFGITVLSVPMENVQTQILLLIVLILLGVGALFIMPLRGRILRNAHRTRLLKLQNRYIEVVSKAADQQIDYGMRLRQDAIQPLTRLVEAQSSIHTELLAALQSAEQEMVSIETALTAMGKKSLLGLRG
jgi:ribosome biogenesis GTPase A